jgi:C4-dicarboxylate-specific signal transduction histidine kinase
VTQRLRGFLRNSAPRRELADLNLVAESAAALLATELRDRGTVLLLDLPAQALQAWGDTLHLEQVLINLLRNAIDAMQEHGNAQGNVQGNAAPTVTVRAWRADGEVLVQVSDNGPGVPPEAAAHLFDAFYTTKPQGMGIGLALSRSIAESFGGTLSLDPAYAEGARFVLRLPAADETGSEAAAQAGLPQETPA